MTLMQANLDTLGDNSVSVQTKLLVDTMAGTLTEKPAETLCLELNNVQAKALVNTLIKRPRQLTTNSAMWRPRHCSTR